MRSYLILAAECDPDVRSASRDKGVVPVLEVVAQLEGGRGMAIGNHGDRTEHRDFRAPLSIVARDLARVGNGDPPVAVRDGLVVVAADFRFGPAVRAEPFQCDDGPGDRSTIRIEHFDENRESGWFFRPGADG